MPYLLSCRKLSKIYLSPAGQTKAVDRLSIQFPERGFIAISGKSGCGKSTLLALLSSLEKPTSGHVLFQGKDLAELSPQDLASFRLYEIGMIFQHYNLLPECNVVENVELPLLMEGMSTSKARKLAEEALSKFFLQGLAKRDINTLSGGEKQRVAVCRALIHSPRILFADEPTGALDDKNSRIVMDELKRLSKTMLVILVSHNASLVNEYCDQIVWMENGHLKNAPEAEETKRISKMKKSHSSSFASVFTKRNIKDNRLANILCMASSAVGFLSLLVSVGYFHGNREVEAGLPFRNLDSSCAKIYRQEKMNVDGSSLSIVQQVAPDIPEAQAFVGEDYIVDHDLSYFAPSQIGFSLDGKEVDPCLFSPCYSLKASYGFALEEGEACPNDSLSYCLVNDAFASYYAVSPVGKYVEGKLRNEIAKGEEKEDIEIRLAMKITGVVHEFSFLNEPKIYYSYQGLKEELLLYQLPILSAVIHAPVTPYDFIVSSNGSSPISSYCKLVFAKSFGESAKLLDLIKESNEEEDFAMESRSYSAISSFLSLSEAFQGCLFLFVGIAGLSLAAILATASFASFSKKKKEAAILYSLGSRKRDVESIFLRETCLFAGLGCLVGMALTPSAQWVVNRLMYFSFDVEGAVAVPWLSFFSVPFLLPLLCLGGSLLISFVATKLTLFFAGRFSPMEELRDE